MLLMLTSFLLRCTFVAALRGYLETIRLKRCLLRQEYLRQSFFADEVHTWDFICAAASRLAASSPAALSLPGSQCRRCASIAPQWAAAGLQLQG
jgi:hypothetical protein